MALVHSISNAIVVGGGIGGLTVAIVLARQGVAVTLIEKAPELTEIGAGVQISSNGLAVLKALALDSALLRQGAVIGRAVQLRDAIDNSKVARLALSMPGNDDRQHYFVHRADLIKVLLQAAREANVTIETGIEVSRVTQGAITEVHVADGTTRRAELVIGADGIHSVVRQSLNGADNASFSGQVAWRALVSGVVGHPQEAVLTMAPGRHLVSYPLREGGLVNVVAVEERNEWAAEGWNHRDDPDNLRRSFADFTGPAQKLLEAVKEVRLWGLHKHPVAKKWYGKGTVLLGDSAHPTLPFLAQGANMALEDAWILADQVLTNTDLETALSNYQSLRMPRVKKVVASSGRNVWRYHLHPGITRTAMHTYLRGMSAIAPGRLMRRFDWLYGHDVTRGQ